MLNKEIFEIAKNKGFEELTISGGKSQSQSFKYERGVFEEVKEAYSDSVTITTYKDGKRISRGVSRPTSEKIEEILNDILELHPFKTKEVDETPLKPEGLIYNKPIKSEFSPLNTYEAKEIIKEIVLKINKSIPKVIKDNTVVYYGLNSSESFKTNSNGLDLKTSKGEVFSFTVGVFVRDGEDETNGYYSFSYKTKNQINIDEIVERVQKDINLSLKKQIIESKSYKIVLGRDAFSNMFSQFVGHMTARSVIDKTSFWKDSLGKKIASESVTLTDTPIIDELGFYITYDADGFPVKERKFIDKGVLKSFFHNIKTAKILKQENTGNSYGQFAGPFNLMLQPGKTTDDEIISSVKNGVLINSLTGFHSGINETSGDFSLEIKANVIKDGKIGKAIKSGVLSGNFFKDMLNNVEDISSEVNYKFGDINPMVKLKKELPIAS